MAGQPLPCPQGPSHGPPPEGLPLGTATPDELPALQLLREYLALVYAIAGLCERAAPSSLRQG
eukprot:3574636-Alexandrium_andersonii.AAC.1